MENEKRKGIIYLVVGITVLVIAIVGSTVAYFAASAGNNTTAITGTTGQGAALQLTVTRVHPASNPGPLIPLDVDPASGDTSQLGDALSHNCIDSLNNTVCHIYSIKVKNTSSGVVNVAGTITITSEAPNLKWKFLTNATTDNNDGLFKSPSSTAVNITSSETLQATNGEQTYYVMVWLEETKTDQGTGSTNDANKNFSGSVTFNAVDTSGNAMQGLTAVFGSAASETYVYTANIYDENNEQTTTIQINNQIPTVMDKYYDPNGGAQAITALETAYAAKHSGNTKTLPFFLRHTIVNDEVSESYVGFTITTDIKIALKNENCSDAECEAKIDNLVNGTYYLKGADSTAFVANAKKIYDAFESNCSTNPYTATPSSNFSCSVPGLYAIAHQNGRSEANDLAGSYCDVSDAGFSDCNIN